MVRAPCANAVNIMRLWQILLGKKRWRFEWGMCGDRVEGWRERAIWTLDGEATVCEWGMCGGGSSEKVCTVGMVWQCFKETEGKVRILGKPAKAVSEERNFLVGCLKNSRVYLTPPTRRGRQLNPPGNSSASVAGRVMHHQKVSTDEISMDQAGGRGLQRRLWHVRK